MNLLKAASLTLQMYERRDDLRRLFGPEKYALHAGAARDRLQEHMTASGATNAVEAAIAYCQQLARLHPGEDVSTAQQFILCAAIDLVETTS